MHVEHSTCTLDTGRRDEWGLTSARFIEGAAAAEEDSDWLEDGLRPMLLEAAEGSTGMPEHDTQLLITMPERVKAWQSASHTLHVAPDVTWAMVMCGCARGSDVSTLSHGLL